MADKQTADKSIESVDDPRDDPAVIEAIGIMRRQDEIRDGHIWTPPKWENAYVRLVADGSNTGFVQVTLAVYPGFRSPITFKPRKPVPYEAIANTVNFYMKLRGTLLENNRVHDFSKVLLSEVVSPTHLYDSLKQDSLDYDRSKWMEAIELLDDLQIEA
ncbi:hypothetical protein [Rhizobium rhizogenes]|jgi:hypothetical protein|uniref:hypothetical protein n=1 Tax=Rhizobium rhizogenes TaxID=359 RepID=UPI001574D257|nr:hypothetical protein [Rhizobium rhizogenes]NTF49070.1 hypothetical protein [Rhizobium rhizogenes]NTH06454.1 hypothetical protein [Rhizobium rhizogenes]NTH51589.1 hypothetical protein [Rhizobium rhizogenes]NTH71173.1 hypothetical protein [Rhizobium rhizogenes]